MARKAFSIHSDYYEELRRMEPGQRGDLLLALICWATDEAPPQLDDGTAMLFRLMRSSIERISKVNSGNGAQGGRPSSEVSGKSGKSEGFIKKPSVTVTDTVPASVTVTDTVPASVTVTDTVPTNREATASCAEPSPGDDTPPPAAAFFLTLNDSSKYPITEEQVSKWAGLYPAVNVMQELRKMEGWLDGNPTRRKTKRGVKGFVTTWLSKEQDKGGSRVSPSGGESDAPPPQKPKYGTVL